LLAFAGLVLQLPLVRPAASRNRWTANSVFRRVRARRQGRNLAPLAVTDEQQEAVRERLDVRLVNLILLGHVPRRCVRGRFHGITRLLPRLFPSEVWDGKAIDKFLEVDDGSPTTGMKSASGQMEDRESPQSGGVCVVRGSAAKEQDSAACCGGSSFHHAGFFRHSS